MDTLEGFPVLVEFPIQWGDQDALAHVNNVIYFRWWETSRVTYAKRIGMFGGDTFPHDRPRTGSVLAGMQCNFRKQLNWPDSVRVGSRVKRVGNSSLEIEHRLLSANVDGVIADAVSTMVAFDFDQQKTVRVSDEIRAAIRTLEGDREIEGL
ncbi:MAG: thioesterase family protein [Planctomycetota bacterium]|nr:thioesterase family protein [Planctomycetota bacterium]